MMFSKMSYEMQLFVIT